MLTYLTKTRYVYILFAFLSLVKLHASAQGRPPAGNKVSNQDTLAVYSGEYAVSPDFVLTFKVVNDELTVIPPGQEPIPITQIGSDVFADKNDNNVQMEFIWDGSGSVEKVIA